MQMKAAERPCPCCGADASHIRFLFDVENFGRRFGQYECRNCEFQFSDPVLSPEETAACYDADYYASGEKPGAAGRYQDYDGQIRETLVFFRKWLSEFEDRGSLRLLDVGCALGRFMDVASSDYGYSCTGVEPSDFARESVRKAYGDRFALYATLNDLPHQHDPFDVILLFDVIEHVSSPWELLWPLFQRGCVGVNTRVLITTPNSASLQAGRDGAKWIYRYPPMHIGFYAPSTLAFIARALLFERCRVLGHSPYPDHIPLETAFDRQYLGFDGLACEFCGSWLPHLETLQASALETFESPAYAKLLRQWMFRVLPHPANVTLYRKFCADLRQIEADLSDERTRCAQAQAAAGKYSESIKDLEARYRRLEDGYNGRSADLTSLLESYRKLEAGYVEGQKSLEAQVTESAKLSTANEKLAAECAERERSLEAQVAANEKLAAECAARERSLEAQVAANEKLAAECAARERSLEAQVAANEKLAAEYAKQKAFLEVERQKVAVLAGDRDQLQTENQALAEKAEAIDAERRRLADTCLSQNQGIARVSDEYGRILAEYQRCHACYEGLLATHSSLVVLEQKVRTEREWYAREHARLQGSFSYRLGRGLTKPYRLIRDGIVDMRTRIDEKLKVFGRKYILRLIVHKVLGWPMVKHYSVITSIGVNCEVSFNFNRVFGFVDSYPLVWAFVDKVGELPKILGDGDDVVRYFDPKSTVHDPAANMCLSPELSVHFHYQDDSGQPLDEKGEYSETWGRLAREGLFSRMKYLLGKQKKLFCDEERSTLCVLTPWPQTTTEEVLSVHRCLRRYPKVRLLVVMTGKEPKLSKWSLRLRGVRVRRIACHPPFNAVTDVSRNDIKGWNQVFHEFQPTETKVRTKKIKYEH